MRCLGSQLDFPEAAPGAAARHRGGAGEGGGSGSPLRARSRLRYGGTCHGEPPGYPASLRAGICFAFVHRVLEVALGGGASRIQQRFGSGCAPKDRRHPARRCPGACPHAGPFPSASSPSSASSPTPSRGLSDLPLSLPTRAPAEALPDVTPTTTTSFPSRQPPAPQPSLPSPGPSLSPQDPSSAPLPPAAAVYFVEGLISGTEALSARGEAGGHGAAGWRVAASPAPAIKSLSWQGFGVRTQRVRHV